MEQVNQDGYDRLNVVSSPESSSNIERDEQPQYQNDFMIGGLEIQDQTDILSGPSMDQKNNDDNFGDTYFNGQNQNMNEQVEDEVLMNNFL